MNNKSHAKQEKLSAEHFHTTTKSWISCLGLIEDELRFIENLLHSYVFEPDTLNLFERLQDFTSRLTDIQLRKKKLSVWLRDHENDLSGLLECKYQRDTSYEQRHRELQVEYVLFAEDYQQLKTEIFNYAGGILRKRRSEA